MGHFDAVVLGAGAAGLMCAIEAGKRGCSVMVLDHAKKPAEKIRISGGGRCNFTNVNTKPENFLSANPRFCVSALKSYTQQDFIALVKRHGIAFHEKTLGQLFCDDSARQIIDMLLAEMKAVDARLQLETSITAVEKREAGFHIATNKGAFTCASLVVATGGKSIPKMGATGFAYEVARQFDLNVLPTRAGLVPLTFQGDLLEMTNDLSGVAVDGRASIGKRGFDEALLFTHRGLSGPAILQISSYWKEGQEVSVDLALGRDVFAELKAARAANGKQELRTALAAILPRRLAERIAADSGFAKGAGSQKSEIQKTGDQNTDAQKSGSQNAVSRLADLSDKKLRVVADAVNAWRVLPNGTEGYRTAEVTLGGVDTKGLSSKTMEARDVPGLYFIGECVDVTGHLGGYNFQWAWSSGAAAGRAV